MKCETCLHWKQSENRPDFGFCAKANVIVKSEYDRVLIVECVLMAGASGCEKHQESDKPVQVEEKPAPKKSLPWWQDPEQREAMMYAASTASADRRG